MIQDGYWIRLDNQDVAQVLAALRFWQDNEMCEEENMEFNAGFGHFAETNPMNCDQINDLCERINCDGYYSDHNVKLREAADDIYGCEGDREICIDTDAAISASDEHSFVMGWVYVEHEKDEEEEDD